MKIEKVYYICDYCREKSDLPDFKYTDNSGIYNRCFDMCSDKCRDKHIEFLQRTIYSDNEKDKHGNTLKEHIKNWLDFNKRYSKHHVFTIL